MTRAMVLQAAGAKPAQALIRRTLHSNSWPDRRTQLPQVRLELTFRCGKACMYCRPSGEGVSQDDLQTAAGGPVSEMTTDQILELVEALARNGLCDFKLTGGEPMLRPDIVPLVEGMKRVRGVRTVHLVTRHPTAGERAAALKEAGLDLLNFSLDSLDWETWKSITGVPGHADLIAAIRTAAGTGIPLKLNTVILKGLNDHEIPALIAFAGEVGAELKLLDLIQEVGIASGADHSSINHLYIDLVPVAEWLATQAEGMEMITQAGGLGHPMPRFTMPGGAQVTVKSIRFGAYYGSVCAGCNLFPCHDALMALRVTPNGMLQFCLARGDKLVPLRGTREEVDSTIASAIEVYRQATPFNGEAVARMREQAHAGMPPYDLLPCRS